jgi:hypothetical protein
VASQWSRWDSVAGEEITSPWEWLGEGTGMNDKKRVIMYIKKVRVSNCTIHTPCQVLHSRKKHIVKCEDSKTENDSIEKETLEQLSSDFGITRKVKSVAL